MAAANAVSPLPPAAHSQIRARWNTLQQLKANRVLLLTLHAVLAVLLFSAVGLHHDALRTVGQDAAPSIIAAQHIKAAIAAMDAEVARELLTGADSGSASLANYDAERVEASSSLLTAAENITYGDAERGPIRTLQNGLSVYEDFAQRARDLHEEDNPQPGVAASMLEAEHEAQTMVDRSLLPAADDLDHANLLQLEQTYRRETTASGAVRVLLALVGLACVIALVWTQLFLSRRTKRTFNLPLLAGTLLALATTLATLSYLADAQLQLRVAKQDAFTSVHSLWRARAVAFETASDESRFLLEPDRANGGEAAFREHAAVLAEVPPGSTMEGLLAAEGAGLPVAGFRGYLADELNNITFPGEREAALQTLHDWERYVGVDAEVRRLERSGKHREAVDLSTETTAGGGVWALRQFDRSLIATVNLNQRVFDQSIAKGNAALAGLGLKLSAAMVLIAILCVVGLAPRIREYQ